MGLINMEHGTGECERCSDLHLIGDRLLAVLEHSQEYSWKGENIVHLIRIVRSTRSDDANPCFMSHFWHDLRSGIRHRKDDRIMIHRPCHIERKGTSNGYSDEHIRSSDSISERSCTMFEIREFEKLLFRDIETFSSSMNDTLRITGDDMRYSVEREKLRDGDSCRSCTIENDMNIFLLFSCDLECIDESCEDDDRRSMLIIVHHWDIEFCLESFLDLETPRC